MSLRVFLYVTFRDDCMFSDVPEHQEMQPMQPIALEFKADSWIYFRLWITNLWLIVITLGLCFPWAKARKIKFFHENTWLHDSHFVSTINPRSMFKGFLLVNFIVLMIGLVVVLLPAETRSDQFKMQLLSVSLFLLVFPWFYHRGLRYRLHNTSYRGVRFSSNVSLKTCYQVFCFWAMTSFVFFFYPLSFARFRELQLKYTRFGSTSFSLESNLGTLYKIFFKAFALGVVAMLVLIALFVSSAVTGSLSPILIGAGVVSFSVLTQWAICYWRANANNLMLSTVGIGPHLYLQSKLTTKELFKLYVTNTILIVLTLGLFIPFASIRLAKYKANSLVVWCPSPDFLKVLSGAQVKQDSAIGEPLVDDFSFDFSG